MGSFAQGFVLVSLLCFVNSLSLLEARNHFYKRDASLVDSVCRQSQVQPFYNDCIQTLTSDSRALASDLPGIARVAVELAIKNATNTLVSMDDLARATTGDKTLQVYLLSCSDKYGEVVSNVQGALADLENKGYDDLQSKIVGAKGLAKDCETTFLGPPVRDFSFVENNQKLINLSLIVSGIADLLRQ